MVAAAMLLHVIRYSSLGSIDCSSNSAIDRGYVEKSHQKDVVQFNLYLYIKVPVYTKLIQHLVGFNCPHN